jgi:biotin operon repressor
MAKTKKAPFAPGSRGSLAVLRDSDWFTIIAALLNDSSADSDELADRLMARSKHGREIKLLRLIRDNEPPLDRMARLLKVSRRTVFRYLNDLERHGVRLELDERRRYHLATLPKRLQRLL